MPFNKDPYEGDIDYRSTQRKPIPGPPVITDPAIVQDRSASMGPVRPTKTSVSYRVGPTLEQQIQHEFLIVQKYIDWRFERKSKSEALDPMLLNGLKISRKEELDITKNGVTDSFSLTHSFVLMYDDEQNKVIPHMLSHANLKKDNIPTFMRAAGEQVGYLGKGAFGTVKKAEKQVPGSDDKFFATEQKAIKVLSKQPQYNEIKCLKIMGQYDLHARFRSGNPKTYLALNLLEGSDLITKDVNSDKYKNFTSKFKKIKDQQGFSEVVREVRRTDASAWPYEAINIKDRTHVAKQLSEQLAFLHANGYAHRDIKGSNIRFNKDNNTATMVDFGLAKKIGIDTQFGSGTPYYMAPEVAAIANGGRSKELVTGQEDVYSLGIVFQKELQLDRDPDITPEQRQEFKELIDEMLQIDPSKRPAMEEVTAITSEVIEHKKQAGVEKRPQALLDFISGGGVAKLVTTAFSSSTLPDKQVDEQADELGRGSTLVI